MKNMLQVRAFQGIRVNTQQASLGRFICPPYDVITDALARRLRRQRVNAIKIELPVGGPVTRYRNALRIWRKWIESGLLTQDVKPAFYLVEQVFRFEGLRKRLGLLAAVGLDKASSRHILPHERTLSKPKQDRAKLLRTLGVNTSPIFGIFSDPSRKVSRILQAARRVPALAAGRDAQGVFYRLWRIDNPRVIRGLERAFADKNILVADGHHRYEVARAYWHKNQGARSGTILAYLCAEEDPGLLVLPTHRVLKPSPQVRESLRKHCVFKRVPLSGLVRALQRARSPYAFGLYNGDCCLGVPAPPDPGVPSCFGAAWLAERVFSSVSAQDIRYFHDAAQAVSFASSQGYAAFILKPFAVSDIRRAVQSSGLLPQKSTYFYPKIATGLVFRSLHAKDPA